MDYHYKPMSQSLSTPLQLLPALSLAPSGSHINSSSSTIQSLTPRPALPSATNQTGYEPVYSSNQNEQNASPSRASVHSLVSTATATSSNVQPLKRKDGHKHMREQSHSIRAGSQASTPLATTNSSLPPTSTQQVKPSHPSPSRLAQVQLTRSNTAPSPKRPPASHSSYGVGTIAGPPPSFDTQRTLSQERVWRVDRAKSLRMTIGSERTEHSPQYQQNTHLVDHSDLGDSKQQSPATPQLTQSSPDTADTQSVPTPTDAEGVPAMEMRGEHGLGVSNSEVGSKSSSESHKSEDLFLNIARVDAGRPSSSRGEKRRSRISLPFLSAPRPATSYNSDRFSLQTDSSITTPRAEAITQYPKRSSFQLSELRSLDQNSEHGSLTASNPGHYSRQSSTLYADTARPSQRTTTGLRNNRLVSEGGYLDRSRIAEQNATESTVSTAAPSTVWDELDDLKSRIRKLELTGKLPPSSAAAMSSAERPRTATTAATTMSSSPKRNNVTTNLQSTIEGTGSNLSNLLQGALGSAQATVKHDIYEKLQAAAQDALQLAALTNSDGQIGRGPTLLATDRQLRKRTESMCRSLTELAFALATEAKPVQNTYQSASRETYAPSAIGFRSRRYSQSNEVTEYPPVSHRIQSRLETRRASTQVGYSHSSPDSPAVESPTSALPPYPGSGNRSTRISTVHRSRRPGGFLDGADDEEQENQSFRPISRAMTDVATRRISRNYVERSREYTTQHPMPKQADQSSSTRTPLPPNLNTNFISRRKYTSPASQPTTDSSPLASRQQWGRISVVHQDTAPPSDTVSEAPGSGRSVSARRSIGLASRIGSSVGNRLRSSKTDRVESKAYKDSPVARGDEGMGAQEVSHEQQDRYGRS